MTVLLLLDSCYIVSVMFIQSCPSPIKVPRQEPRSVATTSLAASMSLSMPAFSACTSKHLGNTAGPVLLFRAFTLRNCITTASSYLSIVTEYRSADRHHPIASLAPSLFESYHSSLLHTRRHICSNPLQLLKTHLCIHRYWTPCVCSLTWASLASVTRAHEVTTLAFVL